MTSVRAAFNALVAALAAWFGFVIIGGLAALWIAAIWSLAAGPTGARVLAVLYVVTVPVMPILLIAAIRPLGALQRQRVRATLGIGIHPPVRRGSGLLGAVRSASTWRQLGFHLAAIFVDGIGGAVVLVSWTVPILAIVFVVNQDLSTRNLAILLVVSAALLAVAPRLSRRQNTASGKLAQTLLGPSDNEALALQVESLTRSRSEIVAATDAERRRIERDLHDGAQQRLVSLAMNLGFARASLVDLPEPGRLAIAAAHDEAVLALSEMRAFIRGLHPAVLNDRGLDAALSGLVAHSPVPVRLTVDVPKRTSPTVEAIAYFIVSESLTNVAKYADATRAEVTVVRTGDRLRIEVTDDGRGGAVPNADGTGLRGLVQRAASVDGTLTVHSPSGGPTTIVAELPCES